MNCVHASNSIDLNVLEKGAVGVVLLLADRRRMKWWYEWLSSSTLLPLHTAKSWNTTRTTKNITYAFAFIHWKNIQIRCISTIYSVVWYPYTFIFHFITFLIANISKFLHFHAGAPVMLRLILPLSLSVSLLFTLTITFIRSISNFKCKTLNMLFLGKCFKAMKYKICILIAWKVFFFFNST